MSNISALQNKWNSYTGQKDLPQSPKVGNEDYASQESIFGQNLIDQANSGETKNGQTVKESLEEASRAKAQAKQAPQEYYPKNMDELKALREKINSGEIKGGVINLCELYGISKEQEQAARLNEEQQAAQAKANAPAKKAATDPVTAMKPDSITVQKGDNLYKIARQQLGKDATQKQILEFINKLVELNNLKDASKIQAGSTLKLK